MNKLLIRSFSGLLFLLFAINHASAQTAEARLRHLLDSCYAANPDAVGIMVHVESPAHKISWSYNVGYADKESHQKIEIGQTALQASNTKTYVAAAALKLVESKKFGLDDPVKLLISAKSKTLLEADGYNLDKITVKQLLAHTSGIADYVNQDYFEFVDKNPDHTWTRDEQIARAVEIGGPTTVPGEKYKYADIEYLLLTEMIERFTKKPFYTAIAELLEFKKNGLNATWFVDLQKQPRASGPLVHQYWDKYHWDSYKLDPSWDLYGGGGLASTPKDLALFFQALFEGKIIKDKALLDAMHTLVLPREESNYCLGVVNLLFGGTTTAYCHGGFWGTDGMYIPELNTSIAIFTSQKEKKTINAEISSKIMALLREL